MGKMPNVTIYRTQYKYINDSLSRQPTVTYVGNVNKNQAKSCFLLTHKPKLQPISAKF